MDERDSFITSTENSKTETLKEQGNRAKNIYNYLENNTNCFNYENRLEVPRIEKVSGDKYLKENNFEMALKHYSKVGLAIKVLFDEKAAAISILQNLVDEYGIPTSLNLSYIYYKQKNWEQAIKHCKIVLDSQSTNIKANYRKAMCLINMGNLLQVPEVIDKLKQLGLKDDSTEMIQLREAFETEKNKFKNQRTNFYNKALKGYFKSNTVNSSFKSKLSNFFSKIFNSVKNCCKKNLAKEKKLLN
jgi:tetratricopeptide (TPR) repeat protein